MEPRETLAIETQASQDLTAQDLSIRHSIRTTNSSMQLHKERGEHRMQT